MTLHLAIKYQFFGWNQETTSIETMTEHIEIADRHGSAWWGRTNSIALNRVEVLQHQLAIGEKTYVFLYGTAVPKSVNADGNLWYRAELVDIHVGNPDSSELIPAYYRDEDLAVAFRISKITQLKFKPGQTPKLPGQTAIRYCSLSGGIDPASLYVYGKEVPLCVARNSAQVETFDDMPTLGVEPLDNYRNELIIDLQSKVIELQDELKTLNDYKTQFQKILNADYLFSSEKFLESWLEENIHKAADNLIIIDRQPSARWSDGKFGRLDLLAMNKETKELVIIEIKTRKRDKRSSYDQFLRYTAWAKKNLKTLAETYADAGLSPTINLQFMIITDYVDEEMIEICKDRGIALLKIFGGLGFEKAA